MAEEMITEEEFSKWVMARESLKMANGLMTRQSAIQTIINSLYDGLMVSACRTAIYKRYLSTTGTSDFVILPKEVWGKFNYRDFAIFWENNNVTFPITEDVHYRTLVSVACFGVRFNPDQLRIALGMTPDPTTPSPSDASHAIELPAPSKNPGGRPRKDYWDALWVEICRQVYTGELIPDKQSIIEKAMLDWATVNGHEMSEQAARPRARLLFQALNAEDKNLTR